MSILQRQALSCLVAFTPLLMSAAASAQTLGFLGSGQLLGDRESVEVDGDSTFAGLSFRDAADPLIPSDVIAVNGFERPELLTQ